MVFKRIMISLDDRLKIEYKINRREPSFRINSIILELTPTRVAAGKCTRFYINRIAAWNLTRTEYFFFENSKYEKDIFKINKRTKKKIKKKYDQRRRYCK